MQYRNLTNTDLKLSRIGLGTWAIGGPGWKYGWGEQDQSDSLNALHEGVNLGINWIDTAPIYGLGHSEKVVGQFLKSYRDRIYIATKCGLKADKKGDLYGSLKSRSIKDEVEQSLKRLQIDKIDIYQIHWPNPSSDIEEAFSALYELKKEGKILYPAVSNFSVEQLERVEQIGRVYVHQAPYSILNRKIERGVLPWCISHETDIFAYSPIQCGLLSNKATPEWARLLPLDDWRRDSSEYFKEPKLSQIFEALGKIKSSSLVLEDGWSMEELAVEWLISKAEQIYVIYGVRKAGQIQKIAGLFEKPRLSSEQLQFLSNAFSEATN